MTDDDLSADELERFKTATQSAITEDQTRAFTRSLFGDPEPEPDSAHDPETGNHVAAEGANPATADPGVDLREWANRLLNPPPPGQHR